MEGLTFAGLLAYGLGGIAILSFLEKFVPVLPSYVMLVLFGLATVDSAGELAATVAAATAGSVAGAVGWYAFGWLVGGARCERLVNRYGKYLLLPPHLYRGLAAAYRRNRFWVTAVGQIVPTARIYLALPAGVIGLPFVPFLLGTALGTLVWNAPLVTLGYLLRGTSWSPAATGVTFAAVIVLVEAAIFLILAWTRRRVMPLRNGAKQPASRRRC
jgi:membrane protein DedA with SNARE-associated domain